MKRVVLTRATRAPGSPALSLSVFRRPHRAHAFAMLMVVVAVASPLVQAQPIPFVSTTIDATSSGDCKAIGDIDGDGKGDAILGGTSLVWYESGAAYTQRVIRASAIYIEFTTDCQAADLDSDGDIDIILGDGGGNNNVLWFENPRLNTPAGLKPNPRVAANWTYHVIGTQGNTVHDVEVADLDADGSLEVITSGHDVTRIWKRSGPTTWVNESIGSLAGQGVFAGDIDRDGRADLATPFAWLKNPGDIIGGTWTRYTITGATTGDECLLADLNGDERLDLITCDAHNRATVYWFEQPVNPTSPTWTRRTLDPSMGAHHPETADFNNDGLPDILMGLEIGDVAIYINQGGAPPTFTKQVIASSGGHNARAGDLDGDSLPDILACDYITNPPVRIHINDLEDPAAPCYPNCDGSVTPPILTANDFVCFMSHFAVNDPAANCDASVVEPILTANDFVCFIGQFSTGCPQ